MPAIVDGTLQSDAGLVAAMRPYACEIRAKSWFVLYSTLVMLIGVLTIAALAPWWPARLIAAFLGGLLMVRGFILFHDFMHGAILRDSRLARAILYAYGFLFLTAPKHWRESHNFHHANVGRIKGSNVGSFPLMTTVMWRKTSMMQRMYYRISRHPLTILFAYLTIFFYGNTLETFLKNPLKQWDSGLALVVHGGMVALLWSLGGPELAFYVLVLPFGLATALGAYLFYAQHTFVGMRIIPPNEWTNARASLESCSYLKLGPVMRWFTGDIGYHHIHHLNLAIPFYRLSEAMKAVPAVQHPTVTTLHPRDIWACFRLKLWDEEKECMVGYS